VSDLQRPSDPAAAANETHPALTLGHSDLDDGARGIARKLIQRPDLDIGVCFHELGARDRQRYSELVVVSPKTTRSFGDDRGEPPVSRMGSGIVRHSFFHCGFKLPRFERRRMRSVTKKGKLEMPTNSVLDRPSRQAHIPERFGVYIDSVYHLSENGDRRRVSSDRSFLLFVCEVGARFEELVLMGRTTREGAEADYLLPEDVVLVPLPHYSNLRKIDEVLAAVGGTLVGFWRGLPRIDILWVFGPHPFSILLVGLALLRGKRVVLGVRQSSVDLYNARVSGWKKMPAVAAVRTLDAIYRFAARSFPVTVQGAQLEQHYAGQRRRVLAMSESIVRRTDVVAEPPERDWTGGIQLLTVGRFETEKNPLLLLEALARLESDEPNRFRLTWVGRGPLEEDVLRRAAELGIDHLIEFRGYVPFNEGLLDLYRRAHVFVHVSLTEGFPKVLIEALASGTPIVATDVGGVRTGMHDGAVALLVPPDDLEALVTGIKEIIADAALRQSLVESGLNVAQELTLEHQADRVVRFIEATRMR
jgi:glycosyltransferase involved in cell wall biosynthesis